MQARSSFDRCLGMFRLTTYSMRSSGSSISVYVGTTPASTQARYSCQPPRDDGAVERLDHLPLAVEAHALGGDRNLLLRQGREERGDERMRLGDGVQMAASGR